MPCESCAVQFSVFKRRKVCSECERYYCSSCLRRGGGSMCSACRTLSTRPLSRSSVTHLKVRDIQTFLQRQNVSTRGCVEKEDLVSLCVSHVNSASYRRRGARGGPFSALKGITNNINLIINSAFAPNADPPNTHNPHSTNRGCYNSSHTHLAGTGAELSAGAASPRARFTTTPGGEEDIFVPVPSEQITHSSSAESTLVRDTADCFEVEDLADTGWEFVARPADPLPNDSEVLMTESAQVACRESEGHATGGLAPCGLAPSGLIPGAASPQRAASALDLRAPTAPPDDDDGDGDAVSLQDEGLMEESAPSIVTDISSRVMVSLDQLSSEEDLEALSVRQLKVLLARNLVEFRGCVERDELLQRARALLRDHRRHGDDIEQLPLEECCKICMAAPLECVLLECGHIATCAACSVRLAECPICRRYVARAVRFFRS